MQEWVPYTLASACLSGAWFLITRGILKDEDNYAIYSGLANLLAVVLTLPLFLFSFKAEITPHSLLLLGLSALVWTAISAFGARLSQTVEVSIRVPLAHMSLFWALAFAAVILGEGIRLQNVVGLVLVFTGVVVIYLKLGSRTKGLNLILFNSLLVGLVFSIDKLGLAFFSPSVYNFATLLAPGIVLTLIGGPKNAGEAVRKHGKGILAWGLCTAASTFLWYVALSSAPASGAVLVDEFYTVVAVVGGFLLFKEREHFLRKAVGTALVIAGVVVAGL